MNKRISSTHNSRIKFALSLQKASVRNREQLFLIEGVREIRLAMQAGFDFNALFVCPEIIRKSEIGSIIDDLTGQVQVTETSREVFGKLAYREDSGGLLAVAHQKRTAFEDVALSANPLILVIESIEKPGNIGAMLRTADAAGADAVLISESITDIFNPNVIRASLGTVFTNQVVCCTSMGAIKWLKSLSIRIYTTALTASRPYHTADYTGPSAIVSGAEATGVSPCWQENSSSNIIIPMFGKADSINVSVATSIVLYEALRQRGFYGR